MRSAATVRAVPLPPDDWCLFLDIDGTLLDLADTPAAVVVDPFLVPLLERLRDAAGGAVALVSGRSIADIDGLLGSEDFAVAGLHGCERRDVHGQLEITSFDCDALRRSLGELVARNPTLLLEDKGSGLAVHYLKAPELEHELRVEIERLVTPLASTFTILPGRAVIEVKPRAHTKGSAITAFMQEAPFANRVPVFLGDDISDYDGFEAVSGYDGMAIAVGPRVASQWWLPDPRAVRHWLEHLLERTA